MKQVDDWRDITFPRDSTKPARVRSLGANTVVTGFGNEYETTSSTDALPHLGYVIFIVSVANLNCNYGLLSLNLEPLSGSPVSGSSITEASAEKRKHHSSEWWFDEDGLFNLDDEGRAEKQQCAVVASNIIRNFSFMPDNEMIMAQHRHCLETIFQCIEDQNTGWISLFSFPFSLNICAQPIFPQFPYLSD